MNYRNATILAVLTSLALCAGILLAGASLARADSIGPATPVVHGQGTCAEDEPCWSWATMGNRRRGIVDMYGNPQVVSPCTFQRLMRKRMIDYMPSDYMRGDRTAMRMRCHRKVVRFDSSEARYV